MFAAYFRIIFGSLIAIAAIAGLLAIGFFAIIIISSIIAGILAWTKLKKHFRNTPHSPDKKGIIDAEYVVIKSDKDDE